MVSSWNLGSRRLDLRRRSLVMGILNVTPDSFSDGGAHFLPAQAAAVAIQMQRDGADIVDIGGESTRPYADPVDAEEECRRVLPVLEHLRGKLEIPISIDTHKASVAEAALDRGAEIINDVTGLEGDPKMLGLAAERRCGVCVMHMKGTPQTMQDDPQYTNVVQEIRQYLLDRKQFCLDGGIEADRICLDPGIGFGKTHQHNLELLRATAQFVDLGFPLLVGHSRKGFIGHVLQDKETDRTAATLGVSLALAKAGAHILRVHDVKPTVEALQLFEAAGGFED